jgi:hypothetical protein
MSERQRLADNLGMEFWDDELLALFALEKFKTLDGHLRQALRQWKMYAEMQEERDLLTEVSAEGEMYRAALAVSEALEGGMTGELSVAMIRAAVCKVRAAAKCAGCDGAYDPTDRDAVIVLTANGQHWVCSACQQRNPDGKHPSQP